MLSVRPVEKNVKIKIMTQKLNKTTVSNKKDKNTSVRLPKSVPSKQLCKFTQGILTQFKIFSRLFE